MIGYKYVDNENNVMKNIYSTSTYCIGSSYHEDGIIKYHKNGFHFSTYPENTLRYASEKRPNEFTILEIEASEKIDCGDDDQSNQYYGFDGMYSSSDIHIIRILPREELFESIIKSNNINRLIRYITLANLNQNEIDYISNNYKNIELVMGALYFYQFKDKDGYIKAQEESIKRILKK